MDVVSGPSVKKAHAFRFHSVGDSQRIFKRDAKESFGAVHLGFAQ